MNNVVDHLVRRARAEDSKAVWEVRNDPSSRENFNNQEEIPFEQHKNWFESKYFGGRDNRCFVLETSSKVIGYCRFDMDEKGYTTSIAIDSAYAGKGFGGILLGEALRELKADKDVFAEIKLSNLSSLKLFEKNGFVVYKTDDENYQLILKR